MWFRFVFWFNDSKTFEGKMFTCVGFINAKKQQVAPYGAYVDIVNDVLQTGRSYWSFNATTLLAYSDSTDIKKSIVI